MDHGDGAAEVYAAQNGWMHVLGRSLQGYHAIPRKPFERMICAHALVCWRERPSGGKRGLPFRRRAA